MLGCSSFFEFESAASSKKKAYKKQESQQTFGAFYFVTALVFISNFENVIETLAYQFRLFFCLNMQKGRVILSTYLLNMGDICKIWKKDGRLFANHSFTNSTFHRSA